MKWFERLTPTMLMGTGMALLAATMLVDSPVAAEVIIVLAAVIIGAAIALEAVNHRKRDDDEI